MSPKLAALRDQVFILHKYRNSAAFKDIKQTDAAILQGILPLPVGDGRRHGLFAADALIGNEASLASFSVVGVDPGVINMVCTSEGAKVTRDSYYGFRHQQLVFDSGPRPDGVRSRATRHNKIPRHISDLQEAMKACPPKIAGTDLTTYEAHLRECLPLAQELSTYYGGRQFRCVRLTRDSRARANLARIVTTVAPREDTIVVFGANFFGRECRTGDVAGPVAVKSIRRKLAQHLIVVAVDEYFTTRRHHVCGQDLDPHPTKSHEKSCRTCGLALVDRDLNAALNMVAIWTGLITTGARPEYLQRPAHEPHKVDWRHSSPSLSNPRSSFFTSRRL